MTPRQPNPKQPAISDPKRLAALDSFGLLDTAPDLALDSLAMLAAQFCDASIALVTLVDDARQFFKARHGFDGPVNAPLEIGYCPIVVEQALPVVISDTHADPVHAKNAASGKGGIRFYAGVPLLTQDGQALGTLCVLDKAPRPQGLTAAQVQTLEALASQVITQFELRRSLTRQESLLAEQQAVIRERDALAHVQAAITASEGDLDTILQALVEAALDAVPAADAGVLELIDVDELEYRVVAGELTPHKGLRVPLRGTLAGHCAMIQTPILVDDVLQDPRTTHDIVRRIGLRSAVFAPVARGDQVLGVVKLQSSKPNAFCQRDLQVVRLFAGEATAGLTEVGAIQAERAAAAAAQRHRAIFDSATQFAIVVTDRDGRVTDWNSGAERILGWSAEEMRGQTVERIFTPEDRADERVATEMRLSAEQGRASDERWHLRKDGGRFWASGKMMPLLDQHDAHVGYIKVLRDRTEEHLADRALKDAEVALRASEASARENAERVQLALAAGAIIGTWVWDLPTDHFTIDEAFAKAFGLDPSLGREGIPLAQIVATVHPDDQAGLAATIKEAVERGGRYAHQYRVRRHDGRYYWLEANGHVEHSPDGTPLRFPGVLIDVATRRLDAALGELSERLRTLGTPEEMALAAAETVGLALDLSRAAYGDVDASGGRIVIRPDWLAQGQPSIAGEHLFTDYGSYIDDLRRGEDVVIDDITTDPRTAAQAASFRRIDVGALVNLPLMERGQLKVVFCLNRRHPHRWSADELTFARRVMDRTEVEIARRLAERELRANEARQRHLLQQMPGFVGVLAGPEHVFEYVNDAYVAISGQRDFIGRKVRDVFPEIEGQGFFELLDEVYATGEPFAAKGSPVRLAGEKTDRFIDHMYQPIRNDDGTITGVFVGGYDVTEQANARKALQDLNADLERKVTERALARGRTWQLSPDLLVVIDANGCFEAFNPAWTTVLGWSEGELSHAAFADLVHPDDQAETQVVWLDAVERGLPALRFENRYRHKDGGWRWLSWVGVPDDGKVYCSARDITANKEQASALLQAEDALRQVQKMEAVGQLTGGVAHDFNNLLTVIKSSTDLLKRPNLAEDRRTRYIGAISDTVDRAAKLTGQLLAFAPRQALKPEVFAVGDSVQGLVDMMRTLTGSRVRITTDLPEKPCFVNADASQFDTALVNLAVNARDAMDGEGKITIAVQAIEAIPAIRLHAAVAGPYVAVSLSDTGAGIPAGMIERIFEPFFTTKGIGKGTGLGLSQVFGFAKQSGGDILTTHQKLAAPSRVVIPGIRL